MPLFEESRELARRAALLPPPTRTLGWESAITPDGPVVLGGYNWWAPFGAPTAEGWALMTRVP